MAIRLGIIGAGTIGPVHAAAAAAAGQTVAAIADVRAEIAAHLAESFDGAKALVSPQQVFDDPSIDAVVIGVPNRWHRELAIAAMEAGKDVLLEKPMGLNAAECRQIEEVASATGRILQIGMVNRYTAVGQAAKRIVDSGDLGTIYHTKAHLYRRRGVPGLGGWFTTKRLSGGGPLIDLGVHLVDLSSWLVGFPRVQRISGKVYSWFGKRMEDYVYESMWAGPPKLDGTCDVEDSAHALIYFEGGGTLDLQVSWAINMPGIGIDQESLMGLFGDQGGLTFEMDGDHLNLAAERHGRNTDSRVMLPEVEPFQQQAAAFAHSVESRQAPTSTGAQGQYVQSILDAIYESSEAGREVVPD
jgi:predicted dehydrogenase